MSLVPRSSPVPPGGYHYIERTGSVETRIDGGSFADVAEKLLRLRLGNSRPPGNPLQDVYDFVCSGWPHVCSDPRGEPQRPSSGPPATISLRCAAWTGYYTTVNGADPGVEKAEAERRAAICLSCPKNINYHGGCPTCVQSINQQSFVFRRGRTTSADEGLGACDVLGEHLRTSVWASRLGRISGEQQGRVPDNCWRKNQ